MSANDTLDFLHDTARAARADGDKAFALWLDTAANDAEHGPAAALTDHVLDDAVDQATRWVAAHYREPVNA